MNYVIVGNGMAGVSAARTIRRIDPDASIKIITDEPEPFYSRPGLMYFMMGYLKEWDLRIARDAYWQGLNAEVVYGSAARISPDKDALEMASGSNIPFDRLLLATGSKTRRLSVPGWDLPGIRYMYTLTECRQLVREFRKGTRAVVIGGGLLGAELSEVWRHLGADVTSMVLEPWYFKKGLNEPQGRIVEEAFRRHGAPVYVNEETAEIEGGVHVSGLKTKSGLHFEADQIGVTIGVEPNVDLAMASGIAINRGILVDESLRTDRANIFAAGDCAEFKRPAGMPIEQLWYSAGKQGEAAGRAMCGDPRAYDPGIFYNSAMFFDVDYVSIGAGRVRDDDQDEETVVSKNGRAARRFIHRSGVITGITTVGAKDNAAVLMEMVRTGAGLKEAKARLGGWGWPR